MHIVLLQLPNENIGSGSSDIWMLWYLRHSESWSLILSRKGIANNWSSNGQKSSTSPSICLKGIICVQLHMSSIKVGYPSSRFAFSIPFSFSYSFHSCLPVAKTYVLICLFVQLYISLSLFLIYRDSSSKKTGFHLGSCGSNFPKKNLQRNHLTCNSHQSPRIALHIADLVGLEVGGSDEGLNGPAHGPKWSVWIFGVDVDVFSNVYIHIIYIYIFVCILHVWVRIQICMYNIYIYTYTVVFVMGSEPSDERTNSTCHTPPSTTNLVGQSVWCPGIYHDLTYWRSARSQKFVVANCQWLSKLLQNKQKIVEISSFNYPF